MRDLEEYAIRGIQYLDELNIQYGNIKNFEVNTRATKRWGQCKKVGNGYSINISQTLLDERNDEKGLINTVVHELLHSVEGCMNHGKKWQTLAEKVNQTYGLGVKRTSNATEKGVNVDTRPHKIKHKFVCEGCGQVIERERESDFTKRYDRYHCGICKSKFKKIF